MCVMTAHRLLIVDDEDNLRSMLAAALSHHGFAVTTAENGREALDRIPLERPELILLDVMMPDPRWVRGVPPTSHCWRPHPRGVSHNSRCHRRLRAWPHVGWR